MPWLSSLSVLGFILPHISAVDVYRTIELDESQQRLIVNAHNRLRAQEPASNMQQMVWDEGLAQLALERVQYCDSDHSTSWFRSRKHGFTYIGENIWWSSEWWLRKNLDSVIQSFYDEKPDYNFWTTGCVPGRMCGHYTQVVWANSCAVGCAAASCPRILNGWHIKTGHLIVCHYGEGGNYNGRRPYRRGEQCSSCKNGCLGNGLCRPSCSGKSFNSVVLAKTKPQEISNAKLSGPDCEGASAYSCNFWSSIGECQKNPSYMNTCCSSQCTVSPVAKLQPTSQGTGGTDSGCVDSHALCSFWSRSGECTKNPVWMVDECRASCSPDCRKQGTALLSLTGCSNEDGNCDFWSSIGECEKNPDFMNWKCRRSCRKC